MRTLMAIGGFIVCAIAIDVVLGSLNPDRLLPTRLCAAIGDWGMAASLFVIPAVFIFTPATHPHKRSFGRRMPLAVLASWFATVEFRMQFSLPALRELARQREDSMYDGVGMNAALFVMGWLPPLIVTLLMVAILQFATHWRRRRDSVPPDSNDNTNATVKNAT